MSQTATFPSTSQPTFYGPFNTSRFGKVLTIDMTAPQASMSLARDCSLPRASVVVTTAARNMMELSKAGEKADHVIVFGSSVDPTEHPELRAITDNIRALRDKWFQRAKLVMVSRFTDLPSYDIRVALGTYNKVITRFEWGTSKTFASMTGAKSTQLATLVKHLHSFENLIVEVNFNTGAGSNSEEAEVKSWIKKLTEFQPMEVHLVAGVDKLNKRLKNPKAANKPKRQKIADLAAEATGLTFLLHEQDSWTNTKS